MCSRKEWAYQNRPVNMCSSSAEFYGWWEISWDDQQLHLSAFNCAYAGFGLACVWVVWIKYLTCVIAPRGWNEANDRPAPRGQRLAVAEENNVVSQAFAHKERLGVRVYFWWSHYTTTYIEFAQSCGKCGNVTKKSPRVELHLFFWCSTQNKS